MDAPHLLNDDGTASIATALMMSHHGLRRDLGRFAASLERFERSRSEALAGEWTRFRATLHGHHQSEDGGVFPSLAGHGVDATLARLEADHRLIDPLLERGDRAFAELPGAAQQAADVVRELRALLDPHLALEDAEIVPLLRDRKTFPPPATDADAALYANGFAWAMHGVADDVLARVYAMLPQNLIANLPAAREAFAARYARVWGDVAIGATRTSVPE
jgi:hypothetical protein